MGGSVSHFWDVSLPALSLLILRSCIGVFPSDADYCAQCKRAALDSRPVVSLRGDLCLATRGARTRAVFTTSVTNSPSSMWAATAVCVNHRVTYTHAVTILRHTGPRPSCHCTPPARAQGRALRRSRGLVRSGARGAPAPNDGYGHRAPLHLHCQEPCASTEVHGVRVRVRAAACVLHTTPAPSHARVRHTHTHTPTPSRAVFANVGLGKGDGLYDCFRPGQWPLMTHAAGTYVHICRGRTGGPHHVQRSPRVHRQPHRFRSRPA